jgi:hypothetical protein
MPLKGPVYVHADNPKNIYRTLCGLGIVPMKLTKVKTKVNCPQCIQRQT